MEPLEIYGGKLTENLVQAIARDFLTHAVRQIDAACHRIVTHIHDEIVVNEPTDAACAEAVVALMA